MKRFISERTATRGMLIIFSLIIVFHLLVLLQIIPFDMVWGGRLTNKSEMIRFEITSISVNIVMLAIVAIRAGILKVRISPILLKAAFWIMFVLFILNTLGNLLSTSTWETVIFTPLTIILAVFSLRLALR